MARIDNLINFLTDVASAIRTKKDSEATIAAEDFDTEILNLPSQGEYQDKSLEITTNGNYRVDPDTGYDAMTSVDISVAISPNLQDVTLTQNGTYTAGQGYDGIGQVVVDVPEAGGLELNIYCQETEPSKKDGIWLETDKESDNIVIDESVISGLHWNNSGLPPIPYAYFHGLTVAKGTDVYLFGTYGNSSSPGSKNLYKYNTLTNIYTKLSDMPYKYSSGTGALVGNYVYIFGANNANFKIAYKYDTLNDIYTQISDVPYTCWDSDCAVYGNDIYLFGGGGDSTQRKYAYKYNTLTDTYTRLTDIPYIFYAGSVAIVDKNIYLFGSEISGYTRYAYKYNILTNTYTRLTDIPYDFCRGAVQGMENKVYLFGTNASAGRQNAYEYNPLTNTYIKLSDIPNTFNKNNAVAIKNKDIYLFGGEFHPTLVQRLSFVQKQYENNSIIISSIKANTECNIISSGIKNLKVKFSNVYYYTTSDGLDNTIPTYYGDGTQWIKFKN